MRQNTFLQLEEKKEEEIDMLSQCLQGKERHEDKEEEEEIEMLSQCLQDKEEEEIEMLNQCLQDRGSRR